MIKRNDNMTTDVKVQMRGGNGSALIRNVLDKGEYKGASRLVATITLEPGSSIGAHIHENEEEIFYIIEGTATYNDNGKTEILNAGDSCVCLSGQEHSIANESKDETLVIFAVILTY
ncbi:MAG: cupin domain-containing protein [Clostridia bacterium]|nr:cupin domain-containing protein [Clostridia bacterium]